MANSEYNDAPEKLGGVKSSSLGVRIELKDENSLGLLKKGKLGGCVKNFVALIGLCIWLAGCTAGKPFVIHGATRETGAHIITEYTAHAGEMSYPHIYFMAIDGQNQKIDAPLQRLSEEAYVPPGMHTFKLRYSKADMFGEMSLSLDALAGHEYVVHVIDEGRADLLGRTRFMFRISDGWSGPVVGRIAN